MTDRDNAGDDGVDQEQPFVAHLVELRSRLIKIVLGILIVFGILFPFANAIYTTMAGPLMVYLPEGSQMIAIEVASPFLTPFKLVLVLAVFITVPWSLHQIWGFVAPGLYRHERRLAVPLLASSTFLFYAGIAFAYFVVFPLVFRFLTSTTPEGVAMMTDITKYLDFVLTIFFAFGVAFEVPIATILLVWMGVTTPEALSAKRPYVIVAAFIVGMFLTPPDIISQTLLALPMWILFELGVWFSRWFVRGVGPDEDDEGGGPGDGGGGPGGDGGETGGPGGDDEYRPLSEQEMDEELDRLDRDESESREDGSDAPRGTAPRDDRS